MTRRAMLDQLKRARPVFYNLVVTRAVACDVERDGLVLHFASPADLARFREFAPSKADAGGLRVQGRYVQ